MLRKNPEKSNLSDIGIFQGKKAIYNRAILETLFKSGCLTAWIIGRKIASQKYSGWELEAKHPDVYSVVQRPKGRLRELEAKGYVRVKGEKFELTVKGVIAALLVEPCLINQLNPYYLTSNFILPSGIERSPNFLDKLVPYFLSDLAEKTYKCLNVINLDGIPENKLMLVVAMLEKEDGSYEPWISGGLSIRRGNG